MGGTIGNAGESSAGLVPSGVIWQRTINDQGGVYTIPNLNKNFYGLIITQEQGWTLKKRVYLCYADGQLTELTSGVNGGALSYSSNSFSVSCSSQQTGIRVFDFNILFS